MVEEASKKSTKSKVCGRIYVKWDICKGCGFCVEFCPRKVLAQAAKFNKKGYHPPEAVNPDKCTGCNLCGLYCPDFAIFGERVQIPAENE